MIGFLWNAPWLCWRRIRRRLGQEALAALGIAIGVALLFAVQISNTSVTGSVKQLTNGVSGRASMMIAARSDAGVPASLATRAGQVDGVRAAAPALFVRANVRRASGGTSVPVQLVGVDERFADVSGDLVSGIGGRFGLRLGRALLLPSRLAAQLGVSTGDRLDLTVGGRTSPVFVSTVVGAGQVGALANGAVVVAPLGYAQQLAGMAGRVTHVIIASDRARGQRVSAALTAIAADRADVVPGDDDARLVEQAAGPNEQSTSMFAAISMLVGVLFTFNAMLLTLPERRRFIAELRMQGFGRSQLVTLVLIEALIVGVVGCAFGLLLGDQLSRHVFHVVPGYLAFAFPVGTERIVTAQAVVIAVGGGLLATVLASSRLLLDACTSRALAPAYRGAEEATAGVAPRTRTLLAVAAGVLVAAAMAVYLLAPSVTPLGIGLLGIATICVLPTVIDRSLRLAERLADVGRGGGLLGISVSELRSNATRAIALAATGALAVFGSVAIEGAHQDLLRGLDDLQSSFVNSADVWVVAGGDENVLTTTPFRAPATVRALSASPLIASVRPYRGAFLDMAGRRTWVIARDPSQPDPILRSQLVDGNAERASGELRAGGAVVLADGLARHLGVGIGDDVALPTPSGTRRLRLAATVTNLGWSPGTILLNADDFRRDWQTADVTGMEVKLAPGVSSREGRRLVASAIPPGTTLTVETAAQRLARFERLSRDGLDRLSQISALMLIAAALAMAAAMSAAIWQQRRRLATLRMQGFDVEQVWVTLVFQSVIVLVVGAGIGAVAGLLGQVLATRWVTLTTGFPAIFSPAFGLAALTFAGVALVATVVVSVPGYLAARVPPGFGLEGE